MDRMFDGDLVGELEALASELIVEMARDGVVREGTVMTAGPPAYRRLDCDGRALAYVRTRPRKRAVRVDVSSLWMPGRPPKIRVPSATGVATLLIRSRLDLEEALAFLRETVERTRVTQRGRSASLRF